MVISTKPYLAIVRVISALLYAYDPDGMGISVGSPEDEYDGPAARLIVEFTKVEGREAVIQRFRSLHPNASSALSEAVASALELYGHAKEVHV